MSARRETAADRDELERLVRKYVVEHDYRQTFDDGTEAGVREGGWGAWYIHVLLFLPTVGLGNLLYALYKRVYADTVRIVVEGGGV